MVRNMFWPYQIHYLANSFVRWFTFIMTFDKTLFKNTFMAILDFAKIQFALYLILVLYCMGSRRRMYLWGVNNLHKRVLNDVIFPV